MVKILSSFLFVLRYFVSGVCLSIYVFVFCHLKLGVLGPWEFLWRAGSYIFCVCDSAVWSAGPVQFYLALSWSGWRDCTEFPASWLCSGYGTVEMVKGVVRFSCFLQFFVSSLGGWMSAVGIFCVIFWFSLVDLWYYLVFSYFVSC